MAAWNTEGGGAVEGVGWDDSKEPPQTMLEGGSDPV